MIFKINTKFGNYAVAVEGESPMECIEALTFLADSPLECPVCASSLTLYCRRAGDKQEFRYYGLRCTNPDNNGMDAHEKTYGQFHDGSGLFYKYNLDQHPWQRIGDVRGGQREEDPQERRTDSTRAHVPQAGHDRQRSGPQDTRRPAPQANHRPGSQYT